MILRCFKHLQNGTDITKYKRKMEILHFPLACTANLQGSQNAGIGFK